MIVRISGILIVIAAPVLMLCGCEGEPGQPGVDLIGDDIQPPLVELVLPLARQMVFDDAVLEVHPIDDGEIDHLEFIIDGIVAPDTSLILENSPWNTVWNCSDLPLGSHFIQASAWDMTGKMGYSNMVMVYKADTSLRPTRDTVAYYNPASEGDITWSLPDSRRQSDGRPLHDSLRYTGYGTRFTLSRPAAISALYVRFHRKEEWTGNEWNFEIRTCKDGKPDSLISNVVFNGRRMRIQAGIYIVWYRVMIERSLEVPREFFVLASLVDESTVDTLALMTDEGLWRNWHGTVRQNGQWHDFNAGSQVVFNPMMYVIVSY